MTRTEIARQVRPVKMPEPTGAPMIAVWAFGGNLRNDDKDRKERGNLVF